MKTIAPFGQASNEFALGMYARELPFARGRADFSGMNGLQPFGRVADPTMEGSR